MEKIPGNTEPTDEEISSRIEKLDENLEKYEVMSPEDVASYKKWAKGKVQEWHDVFKPDCVFLTETSGTEFGYLIKAAYESAYPNEKIPRFYRIDVKSKEFANTYYRPNIERITPENRTKLKEFIDERVPNKDARILVFDEAGKGRTPEAVKGILRIFGEINPDNIILDNGMPETYVRTENSLEGYENMDTDEYIKSTVRYDRKPKHAWPVTPDISKNFKAGIVHSPELRKRALDYIHDLKLAGKKAGEEVFKELEIKKQ